MTKKKLTFNQRATLLAISYGGEAGVYQASIKEVRGTLGLATGTAAMSSLLNSMGDWPLPPSRQLPNTVVQDWSGSPNSTEGYLHLYDRQVLKQKSAGAIKGLGLITRKDGKGRAKLYTLTSLGREALGIPPEWPLDSLQGDGLKIAADYWDERDSALAQELRDLDNWLDHFQQGGTDEKVQGQHTQQ